MMLNLTVRRASRLTCATMLVLFAGSFAAADDEAAHLARLSPEQRALAEWMNGFFAEMDEESFGRVRRMNGGLPLDERHFSTEWSEHDVRVTRGTVMEKAGRLNALGKKQRAERGGREILWSRFYALDMHPRTPLVGMLHAAIVLQFFGDGTSLAGGWLGTMPGTRIEADISMLKQSTDDYFAEHDVDITIYRQLVCKGTHDTVAAFRRLPACVGASFYGPPVYPGDTEKSIRFIAGLYDRFVSTYMDVVEKRADDPFTKADVEAQDKMRKRWLMDQLFSDPYSSAQIPFEVHWMWNAPPEVKF